MREQIALLGDESYQQREAAQQLLEENITTKEQLAILDRLAINEATRVFDDPERRFRARRIATFATSRFFWLPTNVEFEVIVNNLVPPPVDPAFPGAPFDLAGDEGIDFVRAAWSAAADSSDIPVGEGFSPFVASAIKAEAKEQLKGLATREMLEALRETIFPMPTLIRTLSISVSLSIDQTARTVTMVLEKRALSGLIYDFGLCKGTRPF